MKSIRDRCIVCLLLVVNVTAVGCSTGNEKPILVDTDSESGADGDADTDADADADTDADADADGDADADADGDADTDADGDADTDADGDADTDADGDADTDADGDADTDTDTDTDADGDAVFNVNVSLASDVDPNAPGTVGIVTWSVSVSSLTAAHIEFGLDTAYGTQAPVDLNEPDHRTLLLGMKPNQTYHFRVVASVGGTTYTSGDYTVSTGPATNMVTLGSFNVLNESARERGFILTELFQTGGGVGLNGSVAFIIDPDGEIVWWYKTAMSSLARARMSEDGKNMWLVVSGLSGGSLERVRMDTLDTQSYDVGASHDLTPVSGELMAYLDYSETDCDSIYEIAPDGTAEEVFESQDFVSGNGCHSNSLRYSAAEDVYTFSDHQSDVFIVNRDGSVAWQLTGLVGSNDTWGGSQHGAQLLDDSILIFANNGGSGNAAAAIEYDLNGGAPLLTYDKGISTSNLGDVQRLPGGNTLVTFSTSAEIHEFDAEGNTVLTIDTGATVGYSLWMKTLYGPPPDISL